MQRCGSCNDAEDAFGSPRGQLATASSQSACPRKPPSAASVVSFETSGCLTGSFRSACPRGNPPSVASAVSFETSGFSGSFSPLFRSANPRGNPPSVASAVSFETSGFSGSLSPHGTTVVPTPFLAESTGPSTSDSDSLVALLNEILPLQSCDDQSLHLVDIFPTLAFKNQPLFGQPSTYPFQ